MTDNTMGLSRMNCGEGTPIFSFEVPQEADPVENRSVSREVLGDGSPNFKLVSCVNKLNKQGSNRRWTSIFLFKGKEVLEKERQRIIDQYLAGSLAVDEVDAFESLLFDNPELQDEVQLAMSLREGLTDYIAEYANDAAIQLERSTGVLSGFFGKWSAVAAGSFASLMLGVLLTAGLLGIDNAQDGAAEADIPVMTFSRIRSAAQDSQFSYIVDRSELTSKLSVLEMEVDYPASDKYSIELSDLTGDGQPIQLTATPNSRGYLVFSVPNEYFESGNYQIEISAIDDNNNNSSSSLFHTIYKLRVD